MYLYTIRSARELKDEFIKSLKDECQREELQEYKRNGRLLVVVNKEALPSEVLEDLKKDDPYTENWRRIERKIEEQIGKKILFTYIQSKKSAICVVKED